MILQNFVMIAQLTLTLQDLIMILQYLIMILHDHTLYHDPTISYQNRTKS